MHLVWNILDPKRQSDKPISKLLAYNQLGSGPYIGLNRISSEKFETHLKILFDDGYEYVYKIAFPFMQEYGFTGLVFPVESYIGRMNDWGVTFGSINKAMH